MRGRRDGGEGAGGGREVRGREKVRAKSKREEGVHAHARRGEDSCREMLSGRRDEGGRERGREEGREGGSHQLSWSNVHIITMSW